jgi:hypothetical protein
MKRVAVASSMMTSVGYDPKDRTLEIEFRSGEVYAYGRVPRAVVRALLAAPSKGRFFHAEIEGAYPYVRVAPPRRRATRATDAWP